MTSKEKWNKICDYFENYKNKDEDRIQFLWEKLFSEIFGYSSLDNEIDSHRIMKLGSTERLIPDIIIKSKEKDLFVIELKREDLSVDESRKKQLYSYLKQTHNNLGILIANQICLIDYNYDLPDEEQKSCIIDFDYDNSHGIKFIEVFEKENFSKESAKKFINECTEATLKMAEIRKQLNAELIKTLLREHLKKSFTDLEIDSVLKEYEIKISKKEEKPKTSFNGINSNRIYKESYGEKTDSEKLMRDIRSVGMETFIKYFPYYNNPAYETSDIKNLFRQQNENFSENSLSSKASTGKGIIKKGNAKETLKLIVNARNVDSSIREKAKEYLLQYFSI